VSNGSSWGFLVLINLQAIGFTPPVVTAAMPPFQGPLPNIVALPYGQCPPLHFQAPSWRHLLVLMARLSTTRIEATMEAIALTKTALKLRTVIQFVKVIFHLPVNGMGLIFTESLAGLTITARLAYNHLAHT